MNLSGASVAAACKSLGVPAEDLVVVHDDIDLPFGVLKLRCGGGHGGHNGIRSICAVLGESSFARVKVGVGRPPAGGDVAGYVLNPFSSAERARLDAVVDNAAAAVEALLVRGVQPAIVITSYSIHYTKLYDAPGRRAGKRRRRHCCRPPRTGREPGPPRR